MKTTDHMIKKVGKNHSLKSKRKTLPEKNSRGEKLTKTGHAYGILKGKIIITTNCL